MNDLEKYNFMREAIMLSNENVDKNMAPFGAVIVLGSKIIGTGTSQVQHLNDPTAHAEIMAIRDACNKIGNYRLYESAIFTTSEPCPMCYGAILWAGIDRIYYGNSIQDTSKIGYNDKVFYEQYSILKDLRMVPAFQILGDEAILTFARWQELKRYEFNI